MLSVLLMILKVLGMILLILLGTILTLILLVLFVPVRYRIMVHRKTHEEVPVSVKLKATWFLHVLNAAFSYPEAAFLRIRIFCFTIFRSDKTQEPETFDQKKEKNGEKPEKVSRKKEPGKKDLEEKPPEEKTLPPKLLQKEPAHEKDSSDQAQTTDSREEAGDEKHKKGMISKLLEFIRKLWAAIRNIKYTILKICDKIKHIVKNIQYYRKIIQSDTFKRTWTVCSGQVFSLLKSVSPRKIQGNLLIGTGDPASTGQVLAIYGMLYPLLGNHIDIVPDFEQQIIEGDLYVKGRITVFKALKTAWIIYFNKDLRRLIKLLKREAA